MELPSASCSRHRGTLTPYSRHGALLMTAAAHRRTAKSPTHVSALCTPIDPRCITELPPDVVLPSWHTPLGTPPENASSALLRHVQAYLHYIQVPETTGPPVVVAP